MYKGELFNYRYDEVLAAITTNPGISNAELAESYRLSYGIIRALTAAMEKEGDITGRVERWGLYSKTRWYVKANKEWSQMSEMTSTTAAVQPATRRVPFREVEEDSLPAKHNTEPQ
jgi:hypothetical protein